MIKQIGTKIYYCTLSGNVIKVIGDMQTLAYNLYPEDFKDI